MTQFAVVATHPPQLCPSSNKEIRELMMEGAKQIPTLAEKLGVNIITLNVYGPEHEVLGVVEADDIETVRDFIIQSRLIQWNKVRVNPTWSMEEALAKVGELPTLF